MYSKITKFLILSVLYMVFSIAHAEIPIATDSRIKTYIYNDNDVYLVLVGGGFQSSVEFEKGEKVQTLSMGDAYSWSITPIENRLFIKPLENNIRTNMTVITNFRTYQFDIVSKSDNANDSDISYVIRFYYPPTTDDESQ